MRAVLDTNVVVSGIFFGGVPGQILEAWAAGRFELLLSPSIYVEYFRTCARLSEKRPQLAFSELLTTIVGNGTLIADSQSDQPITADPDDDKFLLCAMEAQGVVVSGDSDLLTADGWGGVRVYRPREFMSLLRLR